MMLHPFTYVIGDRPGKSNVNVDVPFVGTKSYKTLLQWLAEMNILVSDTKIVNAFTTEGEVDGYFHSYTKFMERPDDCRVLVLGLEAKKLLIQKYPRVKFFALPHPSGSNRITNDKPRLKKWLLQGKKYIYGEVV